MSGDDEATKVRALELGRALVNLLERDGTRISIDDCDALSVVTLRVARTRPTSLVSVLAQAHAAAAIAASAASACTCCRKCGATIPCRASLLGAACAGRCFCGTEEVEA